MFVALLDTLLGLLRGLFVRGGTRVLPIGDI